MSSLLRRILQVLLPLIVIGGAAGVAYVMYLNRPAVETQTPALQPPGVRVQRVSYDTTNLTVKSQGTVRPRTSSQLVPEISGPVVEVADSFAVGGFFEAGEVLLRIDPYDYQQAVIAGQSQLAQTRLRLSQEEAEADVARREWEELGRGDASALTLRQPQVDDARAAVAAAQAALDRANRDLTRAEIRAPYAGRVQSKDVDLGQFVTKGNAVARIYAVDSAEIRLPLPDEELAYVNVPLSYRGTTGQDGPAVTISSNFAGRDYTWNGRIVRTESEIDPISRMVHVVAEVRDPYAQGDDPSRPPLAAGMFVEAEIEGRTVDEAVVLPWAALRGRDQVLVVDDANRLRFRQVDILRSTTDTVVVSSGLAEGEAVCISVLDTVTEGMTVQIIDDDLRMAENQAPQPVAAAEPGDAVAAPDWSSSREEQLAFIRRQLDQQDSATESTSADPVPTDVISRPSAPPGADANGGENTAFSDGTRTVETAAPQPVAAAEPGGAVAAPDWRSSREEQLAFIRRQLDQQERTAEIAPANPVPTDVISRPSAPPRRGADGGENADFTLDPAQSRDEQLAAIRRELARLTGTSASTAVTRPGPPTAASTRAGLPAGRTGPAARFRRGDAVRGSRSDRERPETTTLSPPPAPGPESAPEPVPEPVPEPGPETEEVELDAPSTTPTPTGPRVAVLPFANLSRNRGDTEISGTLTAALRTALADNDTMGIVPLSATEGAGALAAAEARSARWLVGGGYQRVGDQLRITARVLEVAGGDLVGSIKVDGTIDALDRLTDEMVEAVRTELGGAADLISYNERDVDAGLGIALALFANISQNPEDEKFGQDLKTALTAGLQQVEQVSIVPIEASDDTAALNAATGLRAAWLISGGYQHVAGQLRVTAHLLDVETGDLIQTIKVDGTTDTVVELQERVEAALKEAIRNALSAPDIPDAADAQGADARTDRNPAVGSHS